MRICKKMGWAKIRFLHQSFSTKITILNKYFTTTIKWINFSTMSSKTSIREMLKREEDEKR